MSAIQSTNRQLGARPQSAFEADVLDALAACGVPLQRGVPLGRWTFDARIMGTTLLVECDGSFWHQLPDRVERDARKDAWATAREWTVLRITEATWRDDPEAALSPVLAAWAATGGQARPVAPPPAPPEADDEPTRLIFRASHPDNASAMRALPDGGVRIVMDIPESDQASGVGYLALRECILRITIEVTHDGRDSDAPRRRRATGRVLPRDPGV